MKLKIKIPQFLRGLIRIFVFFVISILTVLYALGYKINVQTRSFEQTGIIRVSSKVVDTVSVFLNGEKVSDSLPYKKNYVFSGEYNLKLVKEGYQDLTYDFRVNKNKVSSISNVVQVYTQPKIIATEKYYDKFFSIAKELNNKSYYQNENELWVDGRFVTRFSSPIYSASLFPSNAHLVLQLGNQLVLMEKDGKNHQILLTVDDSMGVIQYIYKENGRIIQYYDNQELKSLELFSK